MPVICVRAHSSDFQVEKSSLYLIKYSYLSMCINSDVNEDIRFSESCWCVRVFMCFDDMELRSLAALSSQPLFPMTSAHVPAHPQTPSLLWGSFIALRTTREYFTCAGVSPQLKQALWEQAPCHFCSQLGIVDVQSTTIGTQWVFVNWTDGCMKCLSH